MGALYDEYYDHILKNKKVSKSKEIVFSILNDLTDRRGLKQEFDQIDDDIKEELIETWIEITEKKLSNDEDA